MIYFHDIDPIAISLGPIKVHWYGIMYLLGFTAAWWLGRKRIAAGRLPGVDANGFSDLLFYAMLGVVVGGRVGYMLFYATAEFLHNPLLLFKVWDGGMSFHGGVIGTSLGIIYLSWKEKLQWLRVHDYVACCVPFGLFFGRIANFVNQELWGAPADVPWAVRFVESTPYGAALGPARHPSQLYEAGLEGLVLFVILWIMFWRTQSRYEPGKLVGAFIFFYGIFRFGIEYIREPDSQLVEFANATGLHMGQWLTVPMIVGGLYLMATAKKRRERVEPIAGSASVA